MARVRLSGVSKTYRRGGASVQALSAVTLDVAAGELLSILGPSGCGKTTLLRVVAGLDRPDAGSVRFDERDMDGTSPQARGIGFVFQTAALYPHLSIYDNIAFGPRARGAAAGAIDASVRSAARRMHVDDGLLPHRPRQLSGGQRQRTALARALALEPKVLLLDEPLTALDARLRAELRVELARLHESTGATTLFVTHDQAEALALGHRVAVMREGRVEQIGSARDLYERPANVFVAGFIGTPPMALIDANALDGSAADAMTLGFRAADVRLGGDGRLRGTVRAVEDLGGEAFVYVDGAYGTLVARCGGADVPHVGEQVGVSPDLARAHRFDATGCRV